MSRPPVTTSTFAAILARTAGCRYVFPATRVPLRIRGTTVAREASVVQHSRVSPARSGVFGMKWSERHAPSQPVRSTCSQSWRTAAQVAFVMIEKSMKRMVRGLL